MGAFKIETNQGRSSGIGGFFERLFRFGGTESPPGIAEITERAQIEQVRSWKREDLPFILRWARHPEVRKHLDPAPDLPKNWNDPIQLAAALMMLDDYYRNFGEPQKITPMVAVNRFGQPVAVGTIRWRGDPYIPRDARIASIERVIVDPELQGRGIGTTLMATMIESAFTRGYSGKGAREVRLWIMTDRKARPFDRTINFVQRFGFDLVPRSPSWKGYSQKRGIETDRDEAQWYRVTPEMYQNAKGKHLDVIKPCKTINIPSL